MATWTPDASFYPSPRMAMKAPAETLAYVAAFDPTRKTPDGIAVVRKRLVAVSERRTATKRLGFAARDAGSVPTPPAPPSPPGIPGDLR